MLVRESTAYRCLKAKGFSQSGVIPDSYGTMTNMQPALWLNLHMSLEDELPPDAVLVEYIPNSQHIDLSNYSNERLHTLRDIHYEIHQARVYHGDAYPRNTMISMGDSGEEDRVLWVDFDSSQTLPEVTLTERQEKWIKRDVDLMENFVGAMAKHHEEDRLNIA
ncbi:uncharacterized protein ACHE_50973A [Aspergillus chevalieri]|uniref:Protein kinase domain-containing protein n=1 Tax=Aspergillus chevalieri TaxID=182096 RepID=A0A7R7VS21_ASPCH|nr:uncharacterized protein ACHE_50973A [Aspergillus chevalieri]BCR89775.1 hypothetical protein ACHE_50973A [Aspergillus chevalieri]